MFKNLIRKPHQELHTEEPQGFRPEYAAPKKPRIVVEIEKPIIKKVYFNGEPIGVEGFRFVINKWRENHMTLEFTEDSHPKFKGLPVGDFSIFEVKFIDE